MSLASACEALEKWDEAIVAHRFLASHQPSYFKTRSPDDWDIAFVSMESVLEMQTRAVYSIGRIQQPPSETARGGRAHVPGVGVQYGVAHQAGRQTVAALAELGKEPVIPPKTALVWGGRDTTLKAWNDALGPIGFRAHVVGEFLVTAAHLAPYPLVVLARAGTFPYSPDDILALRSYVATGGSLLVIVSPGWDASQPGNQNSLPGLFGVQADQEMELRAKCTKIVPHAITESITSVMAKNAVNLRVPAGTGLIQAGDRTVLAAMPYRRGRVVVASLGQWLQPGLSGPPDIVAERWRQVPKDNLPLETGSQRQLPLLANVVRWLTSRAHEEQLQDLRKPLVAALAAGMRVQFSAAPRESLKDPLQKMISEAEPGVWKEEALWAAGEASLRWAYAIEPTDFAPTYRFPHGRRIAATGHRVLPAPHRRVSAEPALPVGPMPAGRLLASRGDCQAFQGLAGVRRWKCRGGDSRLRKGRRREGVVRLGLVPDVDRKHPLLTARSSTPPPRSSARWPRRCRRAPRSRWPYGTLPTRPPSTSRVSTRLPAIARPSGTVPTTAGGFASTTTGGRSRTIAGRRAARSTSWPTSGSTASKRPPRRRRAIRRRVGRRGNGTLRVTTTDATCQARRARRT